VLITVIYLPVTRKNTW